MVLEWEMRVRGMRMRERLREKRRMLMLLSFWKRFLVVVESEGFLLLVEEEVFMVCCFGIKFSFFVLWLLMSRFSLRGKKVSGRMMV